MNPQQRIKLIDAIAIYLQDNYKTYQINQFFSGYGIQAEMLVTVNSKRIYASDILKDAPNNLLIRMGMDIGLGTKPEMMFLNFEALMKMTEPIPKKPDPLPQLMQTQPETKIKKVFISHAVKDKEYAEHLLDILHDMGLKNEQIFYSSAHGYGIGLGENFIQRLKDELSNEVLVIFLMSDNFFNSTMCMCEMGATWVTTREHVPILIPPFDFNQVKGVFPHSQGMKITDRAAFSELYEKIIGYFDLPPIKHTIWERLRDRVCERIEQALKKPVDLTTLPRVATKVNKKSNGC